MTGAFKGIKGIGTASQTLLEASGVRDVTTLADANIDDLTRLLAQRNRELRITKRDPQRHDVERWVRAARSRTRPAPLPSHPPATLGPATPAPKAAADPTDSPPPPSPGPEQPAPPDAAKAAPFAGDLASIGCIDRAGCDLLEAIGITTVTSLAHSEIGEVSQEIERANRTLRLTRHTPRRAEIGRWIAAALARVAEIEDIPAPEPLPELPAAPASEPAAAIEAPEVPADEDESPSGPLVNYEATEQARELLSAAPLAIPLPARILMKAGVSVGDIPPAILLTEYAGDLDIRVGDRSPRLPRGSSATRPRTPAASYVQISNPAPQRPEVDASRFRKFDEAEPARRRIAHSRATDATAAEDRVALIRAPLPATNRGRDPRSRWYIRGVLHTRPWTMAMGAAVTLLLMALVAPALVAASLLLLSMLKPDQFHWVSPWLLVLPCALPLPGLVYLMLVNKARCQVCGQRQFFHRACLKNSKAHHIPGLGYVASVALHMLIFRWFRCTYCGTPVRLKK